MAADVDLIIRYVNPTCGIEMSDYVERRPVSRSFTAATPILRFAVSRVVQQIGKATDAWIRLEAQIQMEMMIRDRMHTHA